VAELALVDTDVLIAHLRGCQAARQWLLAARERGRLEISVVTVAEIAGGLRSSERSAVWDLLATLHPQPVSEAIAQRAGQFARSFRASHPGIGLADYLIAATAESRGADLATLNVRHFPMFPGIRPPFDR
jgi:predicted nucleic acid-binding protein